MFFENKNCSFKATTQFIIALSILVISLSILASSVSPLVESFIVLNGHELSKTD